MKGKTAINNKTITRSPGNCFKINFPIPKDSECLKACLTNLLPFSLKQSDVFISYPSELTRRELQLLLLLKS